MLAIINGSTSPYPPVISKMMRIDVIGARTMPANTAPMPTTAKAPMESAGWWKTVTSM